MDTTNVASWDDFLKSESEANADFADYQKRTDEDRKSRLLQEEQNLTDDINTLESHLCSIDKKGRALVEEQAKLLQDIARIQKRLEEVGIALESCKKGHLMNKKSLVDLKAKREAVHREWCENFSSFSEAKPEARVCRPASPCPTKRVAYILWDKFAPMFLNGLGHVEPYQSIYKRVDNLLHKRAKTSDIFADGKHAWTLEAIIHLFDSWGYCKLAKDMEEAFM